MSAQVYVTTTCRYLADEYGRCACRRARQLHSLVVHLVVRCWANPNSSVTSTPAASSLDSSLTDWRLVAATTASH